MPYFPGIITGVSEMNEEILIEFDPTDTGHAGAFIRKDGVRGVVHLGETFEGQPGWYWCEALRLDWPYYDKDRTYNTGASSQGPFPTCRAACHDFLGKAKP